MLPHLPPNIRFNDDIDVPTPPLKQHQRGFVLAVAAPIFCVLLNLPSVCGGNTFALYGGLEPLRLLFLVFGVLGCIAFTFGVLTTSPNARVAGRLAGMLFAAAAVSAVALLWLLPNFFFLAILPPFVCVLGIIPIVGVAWWIRNGNALLSLVSWEQKGVAQRGLLEGAVITIVVALALQVSATILVTQATQTVIRGDLAQAPLATNILRVAVWCGETCTDPLKDAYRTTNDPARQQLLREAYFIRAGREIDAFPGGCY